MKSLVEKILKIITKRIIKNYKPFIIGITGSVGKTSTKEAVYAVFQEKYNCRRSNKNYNNEIGLPLTVIGKDSPGKSIAGWIKIIFYGIKLITIKSKSYPSLLILEMGADKPGDIEYLLRIAKCDMSILTKIGESHLSAFNTIDNIKKEKSLIVKNMNENGIAIFNFDDPMQTSLRKEVKGESITYGLNEGADVRGIEIMFSFETEKENENIEETTKLAGISFKLRHRGSVVPVFLPNVIGYPALYSALAAAAAGIAKNMNLVEISISLLNFIPPKGRMNLIKGIKNTIIIDDTYNSSPQSSIEALDAFGRIPAKKGEKKYVVLGDMLELGSYSEEGHKLVGKRVAQAKVDCLVVVGERSRDIARGAQKSGMKENAIFHFPDNKTAGVFVQDRIHKGDLLLIKGSQGARMEQIVKELMAEPLRAEELIVRQSDEWKNK
jgi:UDP-N-acetylmuramoyl-tripeptide--D-alanyl-D-alanine ligase